MTMSDALRDIQPYWCAKQWEPVLVTGRGVKEHGSYVQNLRDHKLGYNEMSIYFRDNEDQVPCSPEAEELSVIEFCKAFFVPVVVGTLWGSKVDKSVDTEEALDSEKTLDAKDTPDADRYLTQLTPPLAQRYQTFRVGVSPFLLCPKTQPSCSNPSISANTQRDHPSVHQAVQN
ncbi:uncharacterized protein BDR25DRAFT_311131 [Lindgomyces ingoldianus]|uniref:Uncharacterized protein n=1 Tax=Lindgomyces ingoldianus TaxID=673940 RepID=A0ACB6R696_9PLEO|nr:uncharacterized protein BDR25DRAFT_311131 [Lindgomyces ingoldianus]KAF2474686.1 hypothetical protein BDR25DRAFT_311131 [Lindgomyces ingoldianus]